MSASEQDLEKAAQDELDDLLGPSPSRASTANKQQSGGAAAAAQEDDGNTPQQQQQPQPPTTTSFRPEHIRTVSGGGGDTESNAAQSDFASPTTDQLLDEAIGSAGSPRSLPGAEEDRAFEAIVRGNANAAAAVATTAPLSPPASQTNLAAGNDDDEDSDDGLSLPMPSSPKDKKVSAANFSSFSPGSGAGADADDLSITDEERLLQSMVAALDENGGVLGEISTDTDTVESAIEGAIREAVSGKSSRQKGHTVVQIKEMHAVVAELRNAKAQVGMVSCVCAQQDNTNEPGLPMTRLQLLVGTTSSLVLLFDTRQKLLGVAGTVADAKGAVTALSCAADASTFVCGYERLSIILWNTDTLEPIRVINNESSSTPFRLAFFRPDNAKFVAVNRDELKFFHTGKVMGKTVFRSCRLEGLVGAGGMQGPTSYRGGCMADAATATLPDPTAPPGSDLLRFFYAVTTQTELLVGSVQFGLTSTSTTVDFRRTIRGPAAGAAAAVSTLSASNVSLARNASSMASGGGRDTQSSFSSSAGATGGGSGPSSLSGFSSAGSFAAQSSQNALTAGALLAWRRKNKTSLSLFVTDANFFEVYALIQTQNDASVSVVQLARMELPLPMRTLNCLDAGCALLGDVHDNLHVVDPVMGKIIESVQSSAGFDMIKRGGFPANVHGSYSDSGAATYFCSADRVAMCTVLSWEARIEALIFLKRWAEALQITQQFACSEDVTAVGLVDPNGNRNTEHVKQYAEMTLLPALLADGLRNPGTFRKLLDKTMDFCHNVGLLKQCLPQMLMFCKTIEVEDQFCYALENLLVRKECSGVPDTILMTLAQFFAAEDAKDKLQKEQHDSKEKDSAAKRQQQPKKSISPERKDSDNEDPDEEEDEDARLETMLAGMTKLQRLERCLMHIVGMDEVILKLAKQYKLWHAVMVVWSLRRQRPDVVIIELSGVADQALVDYLSSVIEGFAPDGITPVENQVDARRKVIAVLQAQPSALRRVAAIPGFLGVVRRAMRIQNLWKVDVSSPRYVTSSNAPSSPPCDKTVFMTKLDAAIEAAAQPQLTSAFLMLWAEEVSAGEANVGDPETFFARVLLHCLPSSSSSGSMTKSQVAAAREALQVTLCELLLQGPAFARAKLPDMERALLKGAGATQLPRLLATILLRQHRFKDAIDVFFDPRYVGGGGAAAATTTGTSSSASSSAVGDIFSFFEIALSMFERERDDRAKEQFTLIVKDSIPRLIAVNSSKLARFVSSHLNELQPFVLKALPSDSREQCEFLKEFLDRLSASPSAATSAHNRRALQTRLLKLMCQYDPDNLYSYLVERDASIEFDIEPVLRAAQQHNITEACAFLFEKTCQIFEAMKLLIRALDRSVGEFWVEEQKRIAAMFREQEEFASSEQQQQQQQQQSSPAPAFKLSVFDAEYESLAALVTSTFTAVRDQDGSDEPNTAGGSSSRQQAMPSNASITSSSTTSSSFTAATGRSSSSPAGTLRGGATSSGGNKSSSSNSKAAPSPTLATIERLLTAGIGLCRRHATKIDPNELRNAWFTLLDLFAKPKRQFQKRLDAWRSIGSSSSSSSLKKEGSSSSSSSKALRRSGSSLAVQRSGDGSGGSSASFGEACVAPSQTQNDYPEMKDANNATSLYSPIPISGAGGSTFPLSAGGVRFHMTMLKFFVEHSTVILAHMVQALDLKEVIEKIVNDSDEESYASLKPVIVGILDLLRFELTSNDLCRKCACHDVVHLSNELHLMLGGAMPLHGVYCWLCQTHLRRHANDSDNMRIFHCGHGFHESCIAGQAECPQCIASSASSALDAEMVRRMQAQQQQSGAAAAAASTAASKRSSSAAAGMDDDRDDTLDPQRCLRRLRHVRAKMDAAKNRRLPLLLSPLPRAPSIAEQESAMLQHPLRSMDLSQAKMLPASAYKSRALPASLATAPTAAGAAASGGGGGGGADDGGDLDW